MLPKYDNTGLWPGPNLTRTYTGIYVDCMNPTPDMFCIEDIAHALSMQPRFGGHLKKLYSVAQHSMCVSSILPPELRLAGLLHDASEAYLCDIPSPVKANMPEYKVIENRYMQAIAERFGFTWPLEDEVKAADHEQLQYEWHCLVLKKEKIWQLKSKQAEQCFLDYYERLLALPEHCSYVRVNL